MSKEKFDFNRLNNLFNVFGSPGSDKIYDDVREVLLNPRKIMDKSELKRFLQKYDGFKMDDNVMYYENELIVVKPSLKQQVIKNTYESDLGFHTGVYTLYKLLQKFYIGITMDDVKYFLESATVKKLSNPINHRTNKPIVAEYKHELWGIDLIDMNRLQGQNKGFRYILTIVDTFTRFTWLFATKTKTSGAIKAHLVGMINEYSPDAILSDHGKEFENKSLKAFYKKEGVEERHGMSYIGQSNGIVEAKNKQVRNVIRRLFIENENNNWIDHLQTVAGLLNNMYSSTTKQIPYFMFHGAVDKDDITDYKDRIEKRVDEFKQNEFEIMNTVHINLKKLSSSVRKMTKSGESKYITIRWTPEMFYIVKAIKPRKNGLSRLKYVLSDLDGNLVRTEKGVVEEFYDSELQNAYEVENESEMTLKDAFKINKIKYDVKHHLSGVYKKKNGDIVEGIEINVPTVKPKAKTKAVIEPIIYGLRRDRVPKRYHDVEGR